MKFRTRNFRIATRPSILAIVATMIAVPAMAQAGQGPMKPVQAPPAQATSPSPPVQATPPPQTTFPAQTAAPATPAPAEGAQPAAATAKPATLTVPAGTKLPLVLHNSITTRNAKPGDPVYLETLFPIVINNKIIVPAGSYVQGEIIST